MQILQRLFKGAHEQEREIISSTFSSPTKTEAISGKNHKGNDIIRLKHRPRRHYQRGYQRSKGIQGSRNGSKNLKLFAFICGKDIPKACFYGTINLNRIGNLNRRKHFVHSMKMKREELSKGVRNTNKKADSSAHIGKKVLPVSEASFSTLRNDQCGSPETVDQSRRDKKKTISRVKELLRWVAATRTDKSGKLNDQQFLRGGIIKAVQDDDDQLSSESPKISFTWDLESCSTTSSVYSAMSFASLSRNPQAQVAHSPLYTPHEEKRGHFTCREGNWITTDSEFVVLEL